VSATTLDQQLDAWEDSERRQTLRRLLQQRDGIDPDQVIVRDPWNGSAFPSTVCFPQGNLAPNGSVIKSTAIDPAMVDGDDVYRIVGPAKVFFTEPTAIEAIKKGDIRPGDVLVLACRGPMGAGMEETSQLTSALRYLDFGKHVALLTDARFSGFSAGACIGHISPEALSGGPIGKLRSGDLIEIVIDRKNLSGTVNLVGENGTYRDADFGTRILAERPVNSNLRPDPKLPSETRLWAALQDVSGGTWGGCVFDADSILEVLAAGKSALQAKGRASQATDCCDQIK
jgi:dihydroxyacid dehydratase/phosphogluconate dehydratase